MEIEALIRKQGGDPFVAPSMREAPLEQNDGVFATCERLFAGEFEGDLKHVAASGRKLGPWIAGS